MKRRGLSLIELVLAIVILGLAVPPLLLQLGAAVRAQTATGVRLNLTQLAAERLGEILADHGTSTRGYPYITNSSYPDEADPGGLAGYRRSTRVREVDPTDHVTPRPGSGIKRLRIVVTGPDGSSLRIESFVADVTGGSGGQTSAHMGRLSIESLEEQWDQVADDGAGPRPPPSHRLPPRGGRP